jgi:hypothetical protein
LKAVLKIIFLLFLYSISLELSIGQCRITSDSISSCFKEIKANTDSNQELWNIDLYGPVLLVDPKTRIIYSNFPDSAGILKQDGEIFSGVLSNNVNIANTAIDWNGRSWAMIMLPLPDGKHERLDLLSHELFHRSQAKLGFKMSNPDNNHLDQKEGRVYLRLELEALRRALLAKSQSEVEKNLTSALYFRKHRYSVFPGAESSENSLELNEGLAAYTGILMSGRDDIQIKEFFSNKLNEFQNYPTFVRSFAYLTTPLYGVLLRKSDKYWNRQVDNNTNLTEFFIKSFDLRIPDDPDAELLSQYGFSSINSDEAIREEKIKKLISEFKEMYIEQSHLEIRFEKMSVSFDPRNIMPVEGYGTVYPNLRITDNWGILTVSNGALLGKNWDKVTVSEPSLIERDRVTGDGWILELKNGYYVEKNSSDLNYSLKHRKVGNQ